MRKSVFALALLLVVPVAARGEETAPAPAASGAAGDAETAYAHARIGFDGIDIDTQDPGHLDGWTEAYRGVEHTRFERDGLYRELGRDDLAQRYRSRRTARIALALVGGGILLGSLVPLAIGIANEATHPVVMCIYRNAQGDCVTGTTNVSNGARETGVVEMGIVAAVGVVVELIAYALDNHPIDAVSAHALAAEHNRALRRRLGLPVQVIPSVSSQGASLRLAVTF